MTRFELPAGLRVVSLAERPDLEDAMDTHNVSVWPEFMLHDPVAGRLWHHLYGPFAGWQRLILDPDDRIVAALNSAPLCWDGTDAVRPAGWDDQFERTVGDYEESRVPNTLGAIQIVVAPDQQGKGLAAVTLGVMRTIGSRAGLTSLIACVRPTHKDRHQLMPIEDYAAWCRPDGLPYDPWLRVHVRAGGRIVRASPESMTIHAPIAKWREWTGLEFPASGPVLLPFGAAPVMVDLAGDVATYHDPNVWMVHELA